MSPLASFFYKHAPLTRTEITKFCILCALEVCDDPEFTDWAKRWLIGENRNPKTAFRVGLRMVRHNDSQDAGFWATRVASRMGEDKEFWSVPDYLQYVVVCANKARQQKVALEAKQWSPEGWEEIFMVWYEDRRIDLEKLINAACK